MTNASNHEKDLAWFREHAAGFDVEIADALDDWAMLAVQGPLARGVLEAPGRGRAAGAHAHRGPEGGRSGLPRLRHGLHRRGRGRAAGARRRRRQRCGTRWPRPGSSPPGLGARDTLRLEVCFHLYGNDLSEDRNPIEAGLGWCCKLDTGFIGSDALRGLEPEQSLVPFVFTGPGIPRQGNPVSTACRRRDRDQRFALPVPGEGDRDGLRSGRRRARPGTAIEVDVRGKPRAAEVREKPLYRKKS